MPDITSVGSSKLAYVYSSVDMRELFSHLKFSDKVIVKPNFVDRVEGTYTSPESLRILFEALDSKIIVTEGHGLIRILCDEDKGLCFDHKGKERDWSWIPRGGWNHYAENDDWDWFIEGEHWGLLKELDKKYLDEKGFTDLFNEFNVKYLNTTDEIWEGNIVNPAVVKKEVEEKFGPLFVDRLYEIMPTKLYELRGSTIISFNKFKHYPTFTLKNLFGYLPEPIRCWWHGPKNSRMDKSIVGINKLYSTFFDIIGVQESMGTTPRPDKEGKFGEAGFKYDLIPGSRLVGVSTDRVELDTLMAGVAGFKLDEVSYLGMADGILGTSNPELVGMVNHYKV